MTDPPPWPPPDPSRPFDWERDEVEWDDSHRTRDEVFGVIFVALAMLALGFGLWLLLTVH